MNAKGTVLGYNARPYPHQAVLLLKYYYYITH